LYSAFLYKGNEAMVSTNEFIITRVFLGDVDAFHSIKKGIEKYLICKIIFFLSAIQNIAFLYNISY